MTRTTAGWIVFIAALGMMAGLLSVDVMTLRDWDQAMTPMFVGSALGHISVVVTAFIGGKLIPTERAHGLHTRESDHNVPDGTEGTAA
jgi:hypothetical protein